MNDQQNWWIGNNFYSMKSGIDMSLVMHWSMNEDILWFDKSMHKLCHTNVGERTYYSKLKWDVLLSILTLCESSQLPWRLGFEGLLPEFMQKQTHFPKLCLAWNPVLPSKIQGKLNQSLIRSQPYMGFPSTCPLFYIPHKLTPFFKGWTLLLILHSFLLP
jgi:hypothetical protein